MKIRLFLVMLFGICCAIFSVGCGESKPVLNVYNWGEYLSEDAIKAFEKEYNCIVRQDTFDSNEAMYSKLKAGATGYDIVVPSSYTAELMNRQGMLETLDLSKLPEVTKNIDKSYLSHSLDPEITYSVPYLASFTGIGYNTEKVSDFKPTWHMFERADLKGKTSLLNDVREVMGAGAVTLSFDANTVDQDELDKIVELVNTWKKQIAKFEVDAAKESLASGEFFMIQTYSGDMFQLLQEPGNEKLAFVIPEEGTTWTLDNFAIMKTAPGKDLAYAFINFMYRPDISAENMESVGYISPNTAAIELLPAEIKNNKVFNIPADIREKCYLLKDLGADAVKLSKAWDRIKQE